jgi:hypothetical protein
MNEHDDVMSQVRESFSGLRMDTPVENVLARSRVRRRRRLSLLTAATAATAGGAAAMTLTLGGPAPARSGNLPPPPPSPPSPGPARLAAFSVTNGPGHSTTLILHKGRQYRRLDPGALRQALARHGIPALVTVGTFCRATSGPPADLGQVLHPSNPADGSAMVINGHAMPPGTRLSIGYLPGHTRMAPGQYAIRMALINDGAHLSCASTTHQPAVHLIPSGPAIRGRK